jgi:hypothetical protein
VDLVSGNDSLIHLSIVYCKESSPSIVLVLYSYSLALSFCFSNLGSFIGLMSRLCSFIRCGLLRLNSFRNLWLLCLSLIDHITFMRLSFLRYLILGSLYFIVGNENSFETSHLFNIRHTISLSNDVLQGEGELLTMGVGHVEITSGLLPIILHIQEDSVTFTFHDGKVKLGALFELRSIVKLAELIVSVGHHKLLVSILIHSSCIQIISCKTEFIASRKDHLFRLEIVLGKKDLILVGPWTGSLAESFL